MVEIRLDRLIEWYDEKTRGLTQPVEQKAQKIVDNIKDTLLSLDKIFNSLISGAEGEDAKDYANRFVEKISSSTSKVVIPNEISYNSLQSLHSSLMRSIVSMYEAGRLYGPKLKSLKAEIGVLDLQLRKLVNEARKLESLISTEYKDAKDIEDTREMIEKFTIEAKQLSHLSESIEALEDSRRNVESELKGLREGGGEESYERLKRVEQELEFFKIRIMSLFSPLEKSMKKMEKLVRNGQYALEIEQKLMLEGFLNDPFQTFISATDDLTIIALLNKVKQLIESGRLELEERKGARALEVLQTITVETLGELRREYRDLRSKEDENKRLLLVDERHSRLENLKKRAEELTRRISEEKTKYSRLKEEELKQKKVIDEALQSIVSEDVTF